VTGSVDLGVLDALTPEREHALTFRWTDLPAVTHDLDGIGGRIRAESDDFDVREIPAYLPEGRGSHTFVRVEKVGRTTRDLVVVLTEAGVPDRSIGVAGLKDKVARTEQWLSIPNAHADAVSALEATAGVRVLEVSRHRNKLGIGHLRGNRFRIRVRDVLPGAAERARAIIAALAARGAPNYVGPQRFGRFGRNAVDGYRDVHGQSVPGGHRLRRFFVAALQSRIFNMLLAERVRDGRYASVVDGDWARKHDTGGTFEVRDVAAEAPRALALDISATLPLYGSKVRPSSGAAGADEASVMRRLGLRWEQFRSRRGDRRITRLVGLDATIEEEHDLAALTIAFTLPKGSYATTLVREITKVEVDAPLDATGDG
jgi:tRNA pseudouridine13 synthase